MRKFCQSSSGIFVVLRISFLKDPKNCGVNNHTILFSHHANKKTDSKESKSYEFLNEYDPILVQKGGHLI